MTVPMLADVVLFGLIVVLMVLIAVDLSQQGPPPSEGGA